MPTMPATVAWSLLSPEAAWIVVNVSWPMSCGYSESEVARQLGTSRKFVVDCLGELRDELEHLQQS
jgi:hypothetical protein